ncbi:MAG: histidine kinase [Rugosibacter sp.]|jgi:two-component system sensor histidine kinase AlgZ|nr:two-component system, LytTR family, sensor histidine kinase AlgZ [Rugosibacter sp.]
MASIPTNLDASRLPDFRQGGVWWRTLWMVNLAALLGVFAANQTLDHLLSECLSVASFLEPLVLLSLVVLYLSSDWLGLLPRPLACGVVVFLVLLATAAVHGLFVSLQWTQIGLGYAAIWAVVATYLLLVWFDLTLRAQTPALVEARLMALTARIRPHFLFNTLNAVLGVMRSEPKRAETALEELADLFRVLMRENRTLVPLSEEIAVARQYLNLERLRLGERIQVTWDMASCPPDPRVPPLMLQPLLENAVYHGIEPSLAPGDILIRCERIGKNVRLEVSNAIMAAGEGMAGRTSGNQMALANIRERLLLFFQMQAVMTTEVRQGRFCVTLEFPYQTNSINDVP